MLKSIIILAFLHVIITNRFLKKPRTLSFLYLWYCTSTWKKKNIHKISINKPLKIKQDFILKCNWFDFGMHKST